MFVHRGHTSKGVIITVPAGKVSALYTRDCRFKSLPGMSFLLLELFFFLRSYSDNALVMMNLLFGFCYLGCQGFLNLFSTPEHAGQNLAHPKNDMSLN